MPFKSVLWLLISVGFFSIYSCSWCEDFAVISKGSDESDEQPEMSSSDKVKHFNATDKAKFEPFECDDDIASLPEGFLITSRTGGDDDFIDCRSTEKTIKPTTLNNTRKQLREINHDTFLETRITMKECVSRNEACMEGVNTPEGFGFVCRERYVIMTLSVKSRTGAEEDKFPIPSSCECIYVDFSKSKKPKQNTIRFP